MGICPFLNAVLPQNQGGQIPYNAELLTSDLPIRAVQACQCAFTKLTLSQGFAEFPAFAG